MSSRISSGAEDTDTTLRTIAVEVLRNGAQLVEPTLFTSPWLLGICHICWDFMLPASVGSGALQISVPLLSYLRDQDLGIAICGNAMAPARISAGLIDTSLVPVANTRLSIKGSVRI